MQLKELIKRPVSCLIRPPLIRHCPRFLSAASSADGSELKAAELFSWVRQAEGGMVSDAVRFDLGRGSAMGPGLVATRAVQPGETLVIVPSALTLRIDDGHTPPALLRLVEKVVHMKLAGEKQSYCFRSSANRAKIKENRTNQEHSE